MELREPPNGYFGPWTEQDVLLYALCHQPSPITNPGNPSPGIHRSYSAGQCPTLSWPATMGHPTRPASMSYPKPSAVDSRATPSTGLFLPSYLAADAYGRFNGRPDQSDTRVVYASTATTPGYDQVASCFDNCSMQSCGDDCSVERCPPDCAGSENCDECDPCTSLDCAEASILDSFSPCWDESCTRTSYGHAPDFGDDFSNQNLDAGVNGMHCLWVMPGQQCDVSVSTKNALGQHVLRDHIEPQASYMCPVETCTEVLKALQAPTHLMQQHNLERYVCPAPHCNQSFLEYQELDNHLNAAHGILDCHWAGCEVSTKDPLQLRSHIDQDHLGFFGLGHPYIPSIWDPYVPPQHFEQQPLPNPPQSSAADAHTASFPDRKKAEDDRSASPFRDIWSSSGASQHSNDFSTPLSPRKDPTATKSDPSETSQQLRDESCMCMWVKGGITGQICGMTFSDGNKLQAHTDQHHVWSGPSGGDKATKCVLLCNWKNCKRDGKPLQNKEKLRRHLFTHTGCTSSSRIVFLQ